jgi:hypothetical protein
MLGNENYKIDKKFYHVFIRGWFDSYNQWIDDFNLSIDYNEMKGYMFNDPLNTYTIQILKYLETPYLIDGDFYIFEKENLKHVIDLIYKSNVEFYANSQNLYRYFYNVYNEEHIFFNDDV